MKERIIDLLLRTKRDGMENLINWMEENRFFTAPCSTQHHLCKEGGLAEHSLNVAETMEKLYMNSLNQVEIPFDSIIICGLLHDIGKCGDYGKPGYVPNMLKGRATKANPNPEPYQSPSKPYEVNKDLSYIDHEIRSVKIISKFIELTEEEELAILWHNGLYGNFKYQIPGKETPLYMIIHFSDMWSSRVLEKEVENDGIEVQTSEC